MQHIIIAGFGFMGTMHAQIYQKLKQARIVAVVDTATARARASMKKLGVEAPLYDDLARALAEVEAEVVDICLPTDLHLSNALLAIKAGRHVFCEKPIALTSSDGWKIAKAAAEAGVTAQVGQCIRFWPEYMAFKNLLESGKAGKLVSLTLQRRSALPSHSSDHWLLDPKRSGGAAVDLHIHDTDFILYLFGMPEAVRSFSPGSEPWSSQIFTQYLYERICVTAECGWNYPRKWGFQMAFQAVFEDGAVEYDNGADPTITVTLGRGQKKPLPFKNPSIGSSVTGSGNVSALGGYFNELQSFVRSLDAGRAPETATPDEATRSLEIVLAELESVKTRKQVSLKP